MVTCSLDTAGFVWGMVAGAMALALVQMTVFRR